MNTYSLMERARAAAIQPVLKKYSELNGWKLGTENTGNTITPDTAWERLTETQEFFHGQLTGHSIDGKEKIDVVGGIDVHEALSTADVSIVFPRVISNILMEGREPNLFLTNQVADIVELPKDSPLTIEFPEVSALQAFEMGEGQTYQSQQLAFTQHFTAIRLRKIGCGSAITEEVIQHSMWPMIELNLRMLSNAIDRKIESLLFTALTTKSQVVFDNQSSNSALRTSGVDVNQNWNASFGYNDLVKMMSVLLGRKYEGTHFLAHPLAWPIFAQDPILRAQFFQGGQLGAGIWNRPPQFDQQASIPFGIQYVPYYALPYQENYTLTGAGSSLAPALTTNVYVIDKDNSLFLATRGDTEMDQMENWYADATSLKARKYCGISVKDQGWGLSVANNVRIAQNYTSLFTINTVSV